MMIAQDLVMGYETEGEIKVRGEGPGHAPEHQGTGEPRGGGAGPSGKQRHVNAACRTVGYDHWADWDYVFIDMEVRASDTLGQALCHFDRP